MITRFPYGDLRCRGTWEGETTRAQILRTMYELLRKNEAPITGKEIAYILNMTAPGILRHLHRLQIEGFVRRVGPPKGWGGGWYPIRSSKYYDRRAG